MTGLAGCPYCDAPMNRETLRLHLAARECAAAPPGMGIPVDLDSSEAEWKSIVRALAKRCGWERNCWVRPAIMSDGRWVTPTDSPGFPDLWLLRPPRLVVIELKTETGRPGPGQREWIAGLDQVPGVDALFAKPSDWPIVVALLR